LITHLSVLPRPDCMEFLVGIKILALVIKNGRGGRI
jgi:hypothetical protein